MVEEEDMEAMAETLCVDKAVEEEDMAEMEETMLVAVEDMANLLEVVIIEVAVEDIMVEVEMDAVAEEDMEYMEMVVEMGKKMVELQPVEVLKDMVELVFV